MVTFKDRPLRVIVYEGTGAETLPSESRSAAMAALLDRGYAVTRVVSGKSDRDSRPGTPLSGDDHTLLVLGAFAGGAAPEIEDDAGVTKVETRDISGLDAGGVLEMVEAFRGTRPMNQPGRWKPWFPVIDYDRCTNCMQCLSFCLFDVYGVSPDGKIQVQNNDNCKTNCPACSRVCPEVAIMFPKYMHGPINGEPVSSDDVRREKMKVDISSLLGGDIYSKLRDRSTAAKSRFSKERSSDKALEERKKCLVKLAGDGFIPAEVLDSLPAPEEIQRRAAEAAERARIALEMQPGQPAGA
jgi:Pyruvate/2-oxoacid:ferredoxin oxidoreductase delta subunit